MDGLDILGYWRVRKYIEGNKMLQIEVVKKTYNNVSVVGINVVYITMLMLQPVQSFGSKSGSEFIQYPVISCKFNTKRWWNII